MSQVLGRFIGIVVHALVSACKGAGTKWSSFIPSKAHLSHNEFLFTVGGEMCDMVLLSFLKIKAGRKRGFMQKDLSRLLPPPPSPSRKPDSPWEIIWQVQQWTWQDKKDIFLKFFLWFMRLHTCLKSTVLKIPLEIKTEEPARLQRVEIYEK